MSEVLLRHILPNNCSYLQTVDLYEGQNLPQVMQTLYHLSTASIKNKYCGPTIGVKPADKNVREIDEQKLREGRNVIGLQVRTIISDQT